MSTNDEDCDWNGHWTLDSLLGLRDIKDMDAS